MRTVQSEFPNLEISNSIKNSNEKELKWEEVEMKPRLHVKGLYYDNTCSI